MDPGMLGLLTLVLVPIQLLVTAFAMRAFSQRWNVEIEAAEDHPSEPPASGRRPEPLGA
jgi:hypothetical protein